MKKEFGTLKGISVYKVDRFSDELYKQGFIQVIDDGDRYWKICTNSPIADGVYDSFSGSTSIYDESELNMGIKDLEYNRLRYKAREPECKVEAEVNLTEECIECLLPELDTIIDEIMGNVGITCDDLLEIASQSSIVG